MRFTSVWTTARIEPTTSDSTRQHPDRRTPVVTLERQGDHEHPQHGGERGRLADRGHERGDVVRRTLVDVGRPHVERHGRHLEAESDDQQGDAGQHRAGRHRRATPWSANERDDLADVGRAGAAVDERDAVQEERRGEAAEHEVLDARLLARRAVAVGGGEHVRAPATASRDRGTARSGRSPKP